MGGQSGLAVVASWWPVSRIESCGSISKPPQPHRKLPPYTPDFIPLSPAGLSSGNTRVSGKYVISQVSRQTIVKGFRRCGYDLLRFDNWSRRVSLAIAPLAAWQGTRLRITQTRVGPPIASEKSLPYRGSATIQICQIAMGPGSPCSCLR